MVILDAKAPYGEENRFCRTRDKRLNLFGTSSVDFLNANHFQNYLWENYARGGSDPFVGISAMPSVHVATAVLFAIAGGKAHRLLGMVLAIYAVIIQVGSVHLGWLYAIDGYFGAFLSLLVWKASGLLLSLWGWRGTENPGEPCRDVG